MTRRSVFAPNRRALATLRSAIRTRILSARQAFAPIWLPANSLPEGTTCRPQQRSPGCPVQFFTRMSIRVRSTCSRSPEGTHGRACWTVFHAGTSDRAHGQHAADSLPGARWPGNSGHLTLPKASSRETWVWVALIHGGPARDTWGLSFAGPVFSPTAVYAVVQPDFRAHRLRQVLP